MRFIDADKLIEKMTQNCPFKIDTNYESVWGIPIIEAITVEWIRQYSRGPLKNSDYWAIMRMVTAWEKENE